ncbi:hypothetical protein [Pseudonocardia sp. TMWB2A]|uniref:hypothetical protein n=1 Tax=Pseudonocardia sp. TMWB2A TaxID=687430 RepID=UPI00307F9527
MKRLILTPLAATALLGAATPVAAGYTPAPSGPHTFSSSVPVTIQKDGAAYSCDFKITFTIDSSGVGHIPTNGAAFSGAFPCSFIIITGPATIASTGPNRGTIAGLTIDPPLSAGVCNGPIQFQWKDASDGVTPSQMIFSSPLSDSTDSTGGKPCKITGILYQGSTPQVNN